MRDKYIVKYDGFTKAFKTKQDIMEQFECPVYIIDKIINKTRGYDCGYCHAHYKELFDTVDIHLIKPKLLKN